MSPIQDLAYVRYQVTDLDRQQAFLTDFGLHCVSRTPDALYMRGAGSAHHVHISERGPDNATLGFGLRARSAEGLAALALRLQTQVQRHPEPGGGQRVRFTDPCGFVVDVLHGQAQHDPLPMRPPLASNTACSRGRLGQPVRLQPKPATVVRAGHVALLAADFGRALAFYTEVLGLKASDTYWAGHEAQTVAAFLHCDLGDEWTDHHTIALVAAPDGHSRFDHSAFEVLDLDDVVQSAEYLRARGHRHAWGVGRHVQGSQIFDYWRDPFGHKIEHWTDGDLVNQHTPTGHAPISNDELRQWAPPLTPEFFT